VKVFDPSLNRGSEPFHASKRKLRFSEKQQLLSRSQKNRSPEYSDPFEIEDVQQIDKEMHIEVSYPAGCDSNNFEIVWDNYGGREFQSVLL